MWWKVFWRKCQSPASKFDAILVQFHAGFGTSPLANLSFVWFLIVWKKKTKDWLAVHGVELELPRGSSGGLRVPIQLD